MIPLRLRLATCIALLAGCISCAVAQELKAPSFEVLLHTQRLLRAGDLGQGIRVGVISTGTSNYAALLRQHILPSVSFYGGNASRGDEGDWMLQVVHRIAPRATLAFCPGGSAERTVACARRLVHTFHADIVVDDINPPPVFEFPSAKDIGYGRLSRAYPNVLFFTGAGNNGGGYYEGRWTPTQLTLDGVRYQAQDFGASVGDHSDPYDRLSVPPGAGVQVMLGTNADPNGAPQCSAGNPDVTLVLLTGFGRVLDSTHGRCPILRLTERHPPRGFKRLRLAVLLSAHSRPVGLELKLVAVVLGGLGVSPVPLEYRTDGGAGNSATAPNLIAVAAVDPNTGWHQHYLYEPFANAGPQCMDYAWRRDQWARLPSVQCDRQPAFVAPDKMPVVMPGARNERFAPFSGDSAPGPAAAGVTALLLSAHVAAHRIVRLLERTALPQSAVQGWSAHYGYGLIDADAAAAAAGVLTPSRRTGTPHPGIAPFRLTQAFRRDRQLMRRARRGDGAALRQLRAGAREGSADAQAWLAQYEHGIGNEVRAVHWALAAALRGEPAAQSLLGSLYNRGWGVPMDPRAAEAWWWRAARAGYATAMFNIGTTIAGGRGATANPAFGFALMRAAMLRGFRFPAMLRALALARLHMGVSQIRPALTLARRFARDPGAIPVP